MSHSVSKPKRQSAYRAYAAILFATLLWASSFIALKYVLISFHPVTVIFLRMAIASLISLAVVPIFKIKFNYKAGDWKWLLAMVLCEPCLYFIFEGYALKYTSASQAGMLIATMPIFTGIGAWVLLKERLTFSTWLGCGIAVLGVIWLNIGAVATELAPKPILGNSLEFIAMIFGGGYAVCVRRLSQNYSPLFLTALQVWFGFLFFLPMLFLPGAWFPQGAPMSAWLGVAYLGVFMSFVAYNLYNYSFKRLPAGTVTIYLNLIPVFTLALGMIFLAERFTTAQYLASALVLSGVIISQRK